MPRGAEGSVSLAEESGHRGAWLSAERHGVDVSLLEESLRKTPEERFRDHSRALRLAQELRKAVTEGG